jgi:hypothetical protein
MAYYSSCSGGMAEFDRDVVISACKQYIERRNRRIAREKEEYITKRMAPTSWLFGLITINGVSRQRAEYDWENSIDMFSPQQLSEMTGMLQYEEVCNLLSLASNTNSPKILVSAENAYLFEDYGHTQ